MRKHKELQKNKNAMRNVAVVVPVYNGEKHLKSCI